MVYRRRSIAVALPLLVPGILAGCTDEDRQADFRQPRSTGSPDVDLGTFPLDVAAFLPAGFFTRRHRVEERGIAIINDMLGNDRRWLLTYRWRPKGWFGPEVLAPLRSSEAFEAFVRSEARAAPFDREFVTGLSHARYRSFGYTYLSSRPYPGQRWIHCFAGRAAYRIKPLTGDPEDTGEPDAMLAVAYCGHSRSALQLAAFMINFSAREPS